MPTLAKVVSGRGQETRALAITTTAATRTSQICIFNSIKTVVFHALNVHFSLLDILETFSFFLRREMTCFAGAWTT